MTDSKHVARRQDAQVASSGFTELMSRAATVYKWACITVTAAIYLGVVVGDIALFWYLNDHPRSDPVGKAFVVLSLVCIFGGMGLYEKFQSRETKVEAEVPPPLRIPDVVEEIFLRSARRHKVRNPDVRAALQEHRPEYEALLEDLGAWFDDPIIGADCRRELARFLNGICRAIRDRQRAENIAAAELAAEAARELRLQRFRVSKLLELRRNGQE